MHKGAYKHQFTSGVVWKWKYEIKCRKCGLLALRGCSDESKSYSEFRHELMTKWGDGLVIDACSRCGVDTVQDIVALTPDPREKQPGTVEPSLGEGPTPAGGQAHGAGTDFYKGYIMRNTIHHLILPSKELRTLLEQTRGLRVKVRHTSVTTGTKNAQFIIDELAFPVESDEPFDMDLSEVQRARLLDLATATRDQLLHVRFDTLERKMEVSNIVI